jgi:hypothetical protein
MIGPIMDKISSRKKVLGLLCPLLSSRQAIHTTTNEKNIGDDKTKSEKVQPQRMTNAAGKLPDESSRIEKTRLTTRESKV